MRNGLMESAPDGFACLFSAWLAAFSAPDLASTDV
jgi:hypothetical protein